MEIILIIFNHEDGIHPFSTAEKIRTVSTTLTFRVGTGYLGDTVDSAPAYVGAPNFSYDFNDPSYLAFKTNSTYVNRTPMIYIGANDGMLHAFNAGFFDPVAKQFRTTSAPVTTNAPFGTPMPSPAV